MAGIRNADGASPYLEICWFNFRNKLGVCIQKERAMSKAKNVQNFIKICDLLRLLCILTIRTTKSIFTEFGKVYLRCNFCDVIASPRN